MPLTALILAAFMLNRGSIPFDLFGLFGRDDNPAAAPASDGVPPAAGGDAGGPMRAGIAAEVQRLSSGVEADVRKFRVAVAPPDFDENERLGAIAVPAFHSYLLKELEAILHLELIELPEATDELTTDDADFYLETEGERNPTDPPTWTFRVRWTAMREGTATWAKVHDSVDTELLEITAREAVASLRRYPFPPTDTRTVELQSLALDSEWSLNERFEALLELHDIPKRYEFVGRDERRKTAVAGAAIVLNSPDPEIRSRSWQAMEDVEDSYLVGPLVDSLLLDPSELVRAEAAKLLAREYRDDPRTRPTMEHALVNDFSSLVRSHARWETLDPDGRREYLASTLGNRSLPDEERIELVAAEVNDLEDYIDRRAVSALVDISRRASPASGAPAGDAEPGAVSAAIVVPVLLELVKDRSIDEWVRASIASALSRHMTEPGVFTAMQELANDRSSYAVNSAATSAMRSYLAPAR